MSTRILVLGLDGLDPEFLQENINELPNISELLHEGMSGKLESTIPPITGPAWSSAMSGMNPGKTNIARFEDFADGKNRILGSHDVKVPRIWNVLSYKGLRTAVIGMPMTYPVEEINGIMVGGFLTPSPESLFTYPISLQDELLSRGYNPCFESGAYEKYEKQRFLHDIYKSSETKFLYVLELLQNEEWDSFIFCVSETDWIQHFLDRPPNDPEHKSNEKMILEYLKYVDKFVGDCRSAAGKGAYVIIMSDHGFGRFINHEVHINKWLKEQGYLSMATKKNASIRQCLGASLRALGKIPGMKYLKRRLPRRARIAGLNLNRMTSDDIDWNQTQAHFYNVFGIVGCVRLNREYFLDETSYLSACDKIKVELLSLKDPRSDHLIMEQVYLREQIYQGAFTDLQPEIVCLFADGYGGADGIAPNLVMDIPMGMESGARHRLNGVYVLTGPGISHQMKNARILDVAPTLYQILQVPIPMECDGQSLIAPNDVQARVLYNNIERRFLIDPSDSYQSKSVTERLRSLGYLD